MNAVTSAVCITQRVKAALFKSSISQGSISMNDDTIYKYIYTNQTVNVFHRNGNGVCKLFIVFRFSPSFTVKNCKHIINLVLTSSNYKLTADINVKIKANLNVEL